MTLWPAYELLAETNEEDDLWAVLLRLCELPVLEEG